MLLFRRCFIICKDVTSLWDRLRCFILKVLYFPFVISIGDVDHKEHTLRTILLPVDDSEF